MSKLFSYTGPDCILGQFGPVKTGSILALTEREAQDIRTDKRFRAIKAEASHEAILAEAATREATQETTAELRERAKRLGVQAAGWIGRQTLVARIQEAELARKPVTEPIPA